MIESSPDSRSAAGAVRFGAAAVRAAAFFAFWLMIGGNDLLGLPVGLATAVAASFVSLRLMPPGRAKIRPLSLLALTARFARQSVISGLEVAWRAFDPRLPLNPGFIAYPLRIAPGGGRSAFCAFSSLLPGTLPTGTDAGDALLVHCLDVSRPVSADLAAEESLFMRALGYD
ncbi:Na+/H+ antiporter subunit E [Methylocella silvestris]|uniref:Sodium:proton antiporter n=1 Tax=Methylocella silvestris TaxID=199596 RepID=A0A2J7TEZ9_METSI|nr:Na+/H+ antiporter subunit E [Methylocella silvestris]PNG25350.1 sodium:proton antiporter [Methylocella silvestris]